MEIVTYVIIGLVLLAVLGLSFALYRSNNEAERHRRTDIVDPDEPPWFV